jgi:hypothetical protein
VLLCTSIPTVVYAMSEANFWTIWGITYVLDMALMFWCVGKKGF